MNTFLDKKERRLGLAQKIFERQGEKKRSKQFPIDTTFMLGRSLAYSEALATATICTPSDAYVTMCCDRTGYGFKVLGSIYSQRFNDFALFVKSKFQFVQSLRDLYLVVDVGVVDDIL